MQTDLSASQLRLNEKMMAGYSLCQSLLFQSQKMIFLKSFYALNVPKLSERLFGNDDEAEQSEKAAKECVETLYEAHGKLEFTPQLEATLEKMIANLRIRLENITRQNDQLEGLVQNMKPEQAN